MARTSLGSANVNDTQLGFGIDIGGSGMKAAIVDLTTGELVSDRFRIDTPQPATPDAMAEVLCELIAHHEWSGPLGVAFPAVVRQGVVGSAANIDKSWIDVDADALFSAASGCDVHMLNDADAAGIAEMQFGVGALADGSPRPGVVMMLTFGTGIGSGLFVDGVLVPNTELGHLELDGVNVRNSAGKTGRLAWSTTSAMSKRSSLPTCSSSAVAQARSPTNGCRTSTSRRRCYQPKWPTTVASWAPRWQRIIPPELTSS
jgi:polyphosphate glucokinase